MIYGYRRCADHGFVIFATTDTLYPVQIKRYRHNPSGPAPALQVVDIECQVFIFTECMISNATGNA